MVERTIGLFGRCHVLLAVNPEKTYTFSVFERMQLIAKVFEWKPVTAYYTTGMVADWCNTRWYNPFLVRGIRGHQDLKAELEIAAFNRARTGVDTAFLPASPDLVSISSSGLKQAVRDYLATPPEKQPAMRATMEREYAPAAVLDALVAKLRDPLYSGHEGPVDPRRPLAPEEGGAPE